MSTWLAEWLPTALVPWVYAVMVAGLVVSFMGVSALAFIWAERKLSGRIQDRLGPTRTGPYGLLQSLADGIKLLTKEDLSPAAAEVWLFRAAPYWAFGASFAGFMALPFASQVVGYETAISLFLVLAIFASEVFGILLAGYASGSKWSLIGGVREAAQVVSYEVPRSLCVLAVVATAGTLSLQTITDQQAGLWVRWNAFQNPFLGLAGIIFFITATASCKRAPFDLAEAESELVAGFHTEYSGLRWSFFFLAEYSSMWAMSALAVILFLGGWHTGFWPQDARAALGTNLGTLLEVLTLILKASGLVLVMMWLRWSLPRLRIDQVMTTCLKYLTPLSAGLLVAVVLWQWCVPTAWSVGLSWVLGLGAIATLFGVFAAAWWGEPRRPACEGVWAQDSFPGMDISSVSRHR